MKIVRIVATDENGVQHVWDGVNGSLMVRTINAKSQPYQRRVEATLLLPAQADVKG